MNKPKRGQRCSNKLKHALGYTTNKSLVYKVSSQRMVYHPLNILHDKVLWLIVLHITEHVTNQGDPESL